MKDAAIATLQRQLNRERAEKEELRLFYETERLVQEEVYPPPPPPLPLLPPQLPPLPWLTCPCDLCQSMPMCPQVSFLPLRAPPSVARLLPGHSP